MSCSDIVRQIYAAFERRDIEGILNHIADDVEWEYGIQTTGVPWLERRRGRDEVPGFFASMAGFELHRFELKTILESGHVVVALIDVELTVRQTGRRIVEEDEVHIWHFDPHGRVKRYGHRVDTHQHWLACGGQAVGTTAGS